MTREMLDMLTEAAAEAARMQERAAVVAYLRAPGTSCDTDVLADSIERGEHRTQEET
jgi:hypothetical protein